MKKICVILAFVGIKTAMAFTPSVDIIFAEMAKQCLSGTATFNGILAAGEKSEFFSLVLRDEGFFIVARSPLDHTESKALANRGEERVRIHVVSALSDCKKNTVEVLKKYLV